MREFDYHFLNKLDLPDHLSSLLANLSKLQTSGKPPKAVQAEALQKAVERLEDAPVPGYAQAVQAAAEATGTDLLALMQLALPGIAYQSQEKSLAADRAFSAYAESKEAGANPLLLVPCLMLDIQLIAPFPQGSIAAALLSARLLLCQAGFSLCRYLPLEETILQHRYFYQLSLQEASRHWAENDSDYLPYIEMVLSLLYLSARGFSPRPASRRGAKRASIEKLVLSCTQPISKAEICQALPDISPTTVEAVLGAMVKEGTIRKVGAFRSARYIKA